MALTVLMKVWLVWLNDQGMATAGSWFTVRLPSVKVKLAINM